MDNFTAAAVPAFSQHHILERHEFVLENPGLAFPIIVVLFVASVVGTFGNVLVIMAVATEKSLWRRESIFIVNLAMSDLYVTLVADPMGIVAKIEGENFFDDVPGLCRVVASLCTISCIASLTSIACLSFNRYIHICHHHLYDRIFTRCTCIIICVCLHLIGIFMVLLNLGGIGDHNFDRKSLECIFDRMATYPYTVSFSMLVWIAVIVTGIAYIRLYVFVRNSQKRVHQCLSKSTTSATTMESDDVEREKEYSIGNQKNTENVNTITNDRDLGGNRTQNKKNMATRKSLRLSLTIFVVYAVFSVCWVPFAILIVADTNDSFPQELHVIITVFAHLHPSINWLVYYATNRKFTLAFQNLLCLKRG